MTLLRVGMDVFETSHFRFYSKNIMHCLLLFSGQEEDIQPNVDPVSIYVSHLSQITVEINN